MRDLNVQLGGHEKFLELCALYATGSLADSELAVLRQHLETCASCRTVLADYRHLSRKVMPLLAEERTEDVGPATGWMQEDAKRRLFETLDHCGREGRDDAGRLAPDSRVSLRLPVSPKFMALLILLAIVLGGSVGYLSGFRRGQGLTVRTAAGNSLNGMAPSNVSAQELVAEQNGLNAQLWDRDSQINSLSAQIAMQSKEMARLKELLDQTSAENKQTRSDATRTRSLQDAASGHDALQAQLKTAQDALGALQAQLHQTLDQRTSDLMQTASLQRMIDELTVSLSDRDNEIEQQQTLLSSDRDIRDLMGARDLYIADVFDIARDGTTKKPFGRVFYTKNKSLVFYAFDLDQQQGVRDVQKVAFQAWGLNDADKKRLQNLGIFYMDNQANRRWVLKFDDPSVLEKINSVFVTVEPSGGSAKPSGKQLLYAFLQAQPNHP